MHIEMIDLLRCPNEHEETWLVAAFTKIDDRFVIEAKLGCPVCSATYAITNGIADLRIERAQPPTSRAGDHDPDSAMRIAAQLNLTVPNSLIVLEGAYASHAQLIAEMTQCRVIALNPEGKLADSEQVGVVLADKRIPLASNSVHGIAMQNKALLNDAPRALRPRARITTSAENELPAGTMELARDDQDIVGEAVGPVVTLRRELRE
jgi:uncharacterized protein YbaR (Trm112 family)